MSDELFLTRVLPSLFVVIGVVMLVLGSRDGLRTRRFLVTAVETEGEVVALKEEPPMEAGDPCTYRPVVSFRSAPGARRTFESMTSSAPPAYAVGETVRVLYDPAYPDDACVRSFASLWLPFAVKGGLGIVFAALGTALLLGLVPL